MTTHTYRNRADMERGVAALLKDGAHLRDMQILPDGCGGWIVLVERVA